MSFNDRQLQYLGTGLDPTRVSQRAMPGSSRKMSYLEAWDVRRTLIRVFGYGGWSADVLDAECVVDQPKQLRNGNDGWHVAYKVRLRLTIHHMLGSVCSYTEVAVGAAHLPDLGEAHDMAVKTAESDALKRAAVNLGDQFGLSLYNQGKTDPVVKWTLEGSVPVPEGDVDEPVVADEETGEIVEDPEPDVDPGHEIDRVVEELRAVYGLDDTAARLQRIADIKLACTAEQLTTLVNVPTGGQVTLETLFDKAASDALRPKADS